MTDYRLHQYFEDSFENAGENTFLISASGKYTYRQIYDLAMNYCQVLTKSNIRKKDRIILYSSKNAECIAMMIACSIYDCIYVPVSSVNPAQRARYIIDETGARIILCDKYCSDELRKTNIRSDLVFSTDRISIYSVTTEKEVPAVGDGAGFILFTSGSTGTPKGVVISHEAAIAFIDWAASEFRITGNDILASIAPFNFDLSVFDIYVAAGMSATLRLYSEDETKNALLMAQNISIDKITVIYATPTFFSTLAHYGKLSKYDYSSLRKVFFAGEVFHRENFDKLLSYWPGKEYSNLYGPTETNVCTFFRVDTDKMDDPVFPIGRSCSYASLLLMDDNENPVTENNTYGELLVSGKSLFNEYWNDTVKTASSLYIDKNQNKYYRTGDLVFRNDKGELVYSGRKDRMIKKNGYRIEPLEIEKVMLARPGISNVAVLFSGKKNQLICFMESQDTEGNDFTVLKQYCQNYLPLYMIPDKFVVLKSMPKTSSGKTDLQALEKNVDEF